MGSLMGWMIMMTMDPSMLWYCSWFGLIVSQLYTGITGDADFSVRCLSRLSGSFTLSVQMVNKTTVGLSWLCDTLFR